MQVLGETKEALKDDCVKRGMTVWNESDAAGEGSSLLLCERSGG